MADFRNETVVVKGFTELYRAFALTTVEFETASRSALEHIGDVVRADAANRFRDYDARSAAGFRVVVSGNGVKVRQSIKTKTGLHPEYGALQMTKALLPALAAKQGEVYAEFLGLLDRIIVRNFPV